MPIGQLQNYSSSDNNQEIPVSVESVRPEETVSKSVISPSGEALVSYVHVRRSKCIRKSPQRYYPVFGAAREWKNEAVVSIVYMIQDRGLNSNVYTNDILSLVSECDAEDCMDTPSTFHMRH